MAEAPARPDLAALVAIYAKVLGGYLGLSVIFIEQ
jgi:hypothetical protein